MAAAVVHAGAGVEDTAAECFAEDLGSGTDCMVEQQIVAEQAAEGNHGEGDDAGPRDWQRFYMGYHQRFVDDCVLELRGGQLRICLAQAPSAKVAAKRAAEGLRPGRGNKSKQQQQLDKASDPALTGTTVWDGAVVLAHYLTEAAVLSRPAEKPYAYSGTSLPTVLELGAGTGGVSLALTACRAASSVTVTDLPDLLPHLRLNVARNAVLLPPQHQLAAGRLTVQPLLWGPEGEADVQQLSPVRPPYDLIVGSDLIYYSYTPETPHSRLLLWTLRRLAGPHTVVYLSLSLHHNPGEVEQFLGWAAEYFYVLRLWKSIPAQWRVHDVLVVRMTPRWGADGGAASGAADEAEDVTGSGERGADLSEMVIGAEVAAAAGETLAPLAGGDG